MPLLWQFHKVHHSAEVMHPISNFREHPVDNFAYDLITGLGFGALNGIAVNVFGYLPSLPSLLGVPLLMLAFNLLAYNLRHCHVWLRWPGRWSMVLPSPAHHHVHHSCHPDHIDKNFAFMFPVWDVIFGTYTLPEDNRDVKFGIGEGKAAELSTCLQLYLIPFRDAWRVIRRRLRRPAAKPAPLPHADARRVAESPRRRLRGAQRNVAQAPFHLIFTYLINILRNRLTRHLLRAHAPYQLSRSIASGATASPIPLLPPHRRHRLHDRHRLNRNPRHPPDQVHHPLLVVGKAIPVELLRIGGSRGVFSLCWASTPSPRAPPPPPPSGSPARSPRSPAPARPACRSVPGHGATASSPTCSSKSRAPPGRPLREVRVPR